MNNNNIIHCIMKNYVITRFSIYDSYIKGFQKPAKIKKKGINYKNYLFSKSRLDSKFSLFEKITLPSVVNQTFDDWEWHIYTSIFLPENYKERLISICSKYEKIKLHFISSFKEFIFIKPNDNNYCTIRLDDDDGLNDTFFKFTKI